MNILKIAFCMLASSLGIFFLSIAPALSDVGVTRLNEKARFADVEINGEITVADAEKFAKIIGLLRPMFDIVTVNLNSPGGDVSASLKIGDLIRSNWLYTVVSDGSDGHAAAECDSACVLIFAAGAVRITGDGPRIGIHRPYFNQQLFAGLPPDQARIKYDALSREVQTYLAKMGMPDPLFLAMMRVPSTEIRMLRFDELKEFDLVGEDPGHQEYERAKMVAKYGVAGTQAFDAYLARSTAFMARCQKSGRPIEQCAREDDRLNPPPPR